MAGEGRRGHCVECCVGPGGLQSLCIVAVCCYWVSGM